MTRAGVALLVLAIAGGCGRLGYGQDALTSGDGGSIGDGGNADACAQGGRIWNRKIDWIDGVTAGTAEGNPGADRAGDPVWYSEWSMGGGLGSADPWYAQPAELLVWDPDWFGAGDGVWAAGDDSTPLIAVGQLTHALRSDLWPRVPRVRWTNGFGRPIQVTMAGVFSVSWEGSVEAGAVDIEIAIARLDASGALADDLFTTTAIKPTADTSREQIRIDVPEQTVRVDRDESIVISQRGLAGVATDSWIDLSDDLILAGLGCGD